MIFYIIDAFAVYYPYYMYIIVQQLLIGGFCNNLTLYLPENVLLHGISNSEMVECGIL